jgi:hypothetical protein
MTPDLFRKQHGWLEQAVEDMSTGAARPAAEGTP